MNYVNRKFGHCEVSWTIESCCLWHFPFRTNIESPFFLVDGEVQTKWRMTVRCSSESENVYFQLTRLRHKDNREIMVHFILSHTDGFLITDCKMLFRSGATSETEYSTWATFDKIDLRLQIIVYASGPETIYECEDIYLRQLSMDLKELLEQDEMDPAQFVKIETYHKDASYVNKGIFLHRIKNPELIRRMINDPLLQLSKKYTYEDMKNLVKFIYTADISPAVRNPRIGTYDLAKYFEVDSLITYYQPDKLYLHSTTKLYEFKITWTISKFASRQEPCFVSPKFIGELCYCVLKISPGNKTEGGNIPVQIEVHLDVKRHVCIRLEMKTETDTKKWIFGDWHKTFAGLETFESDTMYRDKEMNSNCRDGRAIIELTLSYSESPENSNVGKSVIIRKPYSDQQNYIQLSKDMLSLYKSIDFKNPVTPVLQRIQILLDDHGFILKARNPDFTNALFSDPSSNILNLIKFKTLDQLLIFLYSGKFSEDLDVDDVFYLYDIAVRCKFEILICALKSNLKEHLSKDIRNVLNFAVTNDIPDLVDYMNERVNLANL